MDKRSFASMIVKYWYLVEFLGQSDFPVQSKDVRENCIKAARGENKNRHIILYHALPQGQEPGKALEEDSARYLNHKVLSDEIHICLGKMERFHFADYLKRVLNSNIELPEKNDKSICLIGLKCDERGKYISDSIQLSPLVWGIYRISTDLGELTRENMADLLSIDAYQSDMQLLNDQLVEQEGNTKTGMVLTADLLDSVKKGVEKKYLEKIIRKEEKINWECIMIYRRYQNEDTKAKDADVFHDSDLANSFFVDDLHMVEKALKNKTFGQKTFEQAILDYIIGIYAEEKQELEWMNFQKRIDVHSAWGKGQEEERADFFHCHLDIARAPLGKWPSKYMPCLMQQMAINLCWSPNQDNQPIFSVNGPPGTGKTTLLKEIVAGNVVERACMLAKYKDPDDAFVQHTFQDGDSLKRGYSKYCWGYYAFKDENLKDYGMLVASCNNAAVENITKELPDGTALLKGLEPGGKEEDTIRRGLIEVGNLFCPNEEVQEKYLVWNQQEEGYRYQSYSDVYFTKLANDLSKRKDNEWDRWGLISAPFGKMSNLKEYMRAVLKPYIRSFGPSECIQFHKESYAEAVQRFEKQLETVQQMKQELLQVSDARRCFSQDKAALNRQMHSASELKHRQELEEARLMKEIQELIRQSEQAEQVLKNEQAELVCLQNQLLQQNKHQKEVETQIGGIRQHIMELEERRRFRDIFFEIIHRPTMLSRTIQEQYQGLSEKEQILSQETVKTDQLKRELERQIKEENDQSHIFYDIENRKKRLCDEQCNIQEQIHQLQWQLETCLDKIKEASRRYHMFLKEASQRQGDQAMTVLDEEFFRLYDSEVNEESTKAQLANPWHTAAYNREREKLFCEALRLHKAFLLGSKACLWNFKNLLLLWKEPRDDDNKSVIFSQRDREAAFGSILNTVFLLTPVLSTTFASAGNMLASIRNPGEIGCLIIDEAGQAAPQMALGSLYRCRRAIVVGDPRQVEPVVTDELDLIKQVIQNDYTGYYQSKRHSVQEFADRLNSIGTTYVEDGYKTWVGCPLVVHRRCISPMFELSNALSYNQMMKQQTALPDPAKESGFCRESSGWINVGGSEKNKEGKDHYVENQGRKAWELIQKSFQRSQGMPSLFVITPFTTVRDGLKKLIRSQPEYQKDKRLSNWVDQCIGTVHTFQGKEADEVVFLLGCDKNSLSAVRWVNTNIVNVAATRAKYRFYVIGDFTVWQHSPLFCKVKGILDSHALRTLQKTMDSPDDQGDEKQIGRLLKEMPGADSLTMDGELEESLVTPLFRELDVLWRSSVLTSSQLEAFGFSEAEMQELPGGIQKRLTSSILLHELFNKLRERYRLEEMDASCAGILFCKTMESLLKELLLGRLKVIFPDEEVNRKKFRDIEEQKVTTGTFTHILNKEELRSSLASRMVRLFGQVCDDQWWKTYAEDLEAFRKLRNTCCHSETFSWQQEKELISILFHRQEFMKTLVGKAL